ncbi:DUF6191 domain-containing protein [Nocardia higoensis]|uniref:DUF6191 domain-containing protein n=1 Tax=Nocardia higoensis TaxID=228599 RepID=UPI0002E88885|nr:DUF6191 domain-containing protein [Nocardia higoensis]
MGSVWFAIGVVAVLVVFDQLALWAERRGWMYWRKSKGGSAAATGVLEHMDNLFNPGTRNLIEERESKRLVRVDIDAASGGGELDLESRTVYLRVGKTTS